MIRLSVAAAGNADENINLINPRFQAEALRRIRCCDVGVLDNSFNNTERSDGLERVSNPDFMWKLSATNVSNIAIGRGMATAYGYDIQSEQTVYLSGTAPSAGIKYLFIYLVFDLSNPSEAVGGIDIYDNGSSPNWQPSLQDNLITNPIGTYQLPLYRLAVDTSGSITSTDWNTLGVATIGNVLRSEYANKAENADVAKYAEGDTSTTIKQHIDAIYARLIAMGFSHSGIELSLGSTAFSLSDSKQANGYYPLQRQGNYVIGNFQILADDETGTTTNQLYTAIYSGGTYTYTLGTLPDNFRPKTEVSAGFNGTIGPDNYIVFLSDLVKIKIQTSGAIVLTVTASYTNTTLTDGSYKIGIRSITFGFEAESLSSPINGYTTVWTGSAAGVSEWRYSYFCPLGDSVNTDWKGEYLITVVNTLTDKTEVVQAKLTAQNWSTTVFGNEIGCGDFDDYNLGDSAGWWCIYNCGSSDVVVTSVIKAE
jgi:hypothetical protein